MANPTTNFGWVMPTSTDLVTDLPADFNVFGQGVDTSMQYLLGGTTGQVLSKTSGTNMAFTWVTPTDQTPLTTKGDLFTYTTADARLGVGTNGQILSANSAQATGLEWVTPNPGDITAVNVTSPITGGGTSGDVTIAIQDALTTQKGAVQLSDSTSTTSSILAATPTAVKSAYDLASGAIAKTTVTTAGDIIYRNATVPTRLGIGTAGQVLAVNSGATAPEWTTASGGGLVKIVSASFTASAGLSVNGCFTSTYKNYKVVFRVKASTAAGTIAWRWRTSGTDLSTASYYYGWNLTNNNATTTLGGANAATSIDLGGITETGYFNNYSYDIFGPQANTQVPSFYGGGTFTNAGQRGFGGGISVTVGAYDGFSLVTTQNITGEYTVYGYAN